jgi:subtilisin
MMRLLATLALVALLVVPLAPIVPVAVAAPLEKQSYIVVLRDDVADRFDNAAAFAESVGVTPTNVYEVVLRGFAADLTEAQARALRRSTLVASVEPDRTRFALGTPQIGSNRVGADNVNGTGRPPGAGVPVAVLDTGVSAHADLTLRTGYNCTSTSRGATADGDGHGTHVAGIIGARGSAEGVAPGTPILPVKVLGNDGSGLDSWIICGLDWVAGAGNGGVPRATVLNMSLGGPDNESATQCSSSAFHQAVCNAAAKGIQVVVAAGNESMDASLASPSKYSQVITVSALNDTDGCAGGRGASNYEGADESRAGFSNYGSVVDYAAPGVGIRSTRPGGGYQTMSGTSMASPHVAALIALGALATESSGFGEPIAVLAGGDRSCAEANDNRSLTAGTALDGTIGTYGDTDSYKFTATAGQIVAIGMLPASGSAIDARISVLTSTGVAVASNDGVAAPGATSAVLDGLTLASAGTYTIVASGVSGTTGAYSIVVASDAEHGRTIPTGQSSINGQFEPPYESDRFVFSGSTGQYFTAKLTVSGAAFAASLEIWRYNSVSATWVLVPGPYGGATSAEITNFQLPAVANYALVANPTTAGSRGGYLLTTSLGSGPAATATLTPLVTGSPTVTGTVTALATATPTFTPIPPTATPTSTSTRTPTSTPTVPPTATVASTLLTLGVATTGSVNVGGVAVYQVDGIAGRLLAVGVSPEGGSGIDPYIELFSPSGVLLASNDDAGWDNYGRGRLDALLDGVALPATGRYTIRVSGVVGTSGLFRIVAADDTEDGSSLTSGVARTGSLVPMTDVDAFYFDAQAGRFLTLRMTATSGGLDGVVTVLSWNTFTRQWTTVASVDDVGASLDPAILGLQLTAGGAYAVLVESSGWDTAGGYSITVQVTSGAATPTPTRTPTRAATRTPTRAGSRTPTRAATRTPTPRRGFNLTATPTATPTWPPIWTATPPATATAVATNTVEPSPTATPQSTATPQPEGGPSASPDAGRSMRPGV